MESKEIITMLRTLRNEGVKYKLIAENCDIAPSSLYEYMRVGKIPLLERKRIEKFIKDNFY